ncbi:hypothetical protein [Pantoea ananatis]|uniref:hypothetical protein n=1 Tax=Pantoea ananas TaxID=553 RepID=UPI0023AE8DCC|nr:hypothetical protein [Pantoea ananatis]
MLSNKSNKEPVEAGHQFAKELAADMPLTEIAKLVSAISTRLDCAIVRGDELQQKLDALAAENAALKAGVTYFACGSEYGFDLFREKQAAIDVCLEEIDLHREGYLDGDGWDDDVRKTAWGVVIQSAQGRDAQGLHTSDSRHTYQTCDYRLEDEVKTPATDAYLSSVRADAVVEASAHLADMAEGKSPHTAELIKSCGRAVFAYAAQLRSGTHETADKAG